MCARWLLIIQNGDYFLFCCQIGEQRCSNRADYSAGCTSVKSGRKNSGCISAFYMMLLLYNVEGATFILVKVVGNVNDNIHLKRCF